MKDEMLIITPAVFAVGKEYQIMVPVECETTMWVQIGDALYYDHDNGIMRSNTMVHKVAVPMEVLDQERRYTIYLRKFVDRTPYYPKSLEPVKQTFDFKPVSGNHIRAYHISDAHNRVEEPVKAAEAFGKIDFLILNGDIPDHCGKLENVYTIFKLASAITGGEIPIVFARGNHDMRGHYGEKFSEVTPCLNGKPYYTFRLGGIWGLILDCGEDKSDESVEYGHTICCHNFRLKETAFIKKVIEHADEEYLKEDVTHRIVLVHMPFTRRYEGIFDIEQEIYAQWTALLREYIKPQMILCGHMHKQDIYRCGGEYDAFGQPCPVVIGAERNVLSEERDEIYFSGVGVTFSEEGIGLSFTDSLGNVRKEII